MIFELLISGLYHFSYLAVLAIGFALVYQLTKIFHIAYAGLFTFSGYIFWFLFQHSDLTFLSSMLLTFGCTVTLSLFCLLIYKLVEKRNNDKTALMISSIGLMIIITHGVTVFLGFDPKLISNSFDWSLNPSIAGLYKIQPIILIINLLIIFGYLILVKRSALGVLIRSYKDNTTLYKLSGRNSTLLVMLIFIVSGLLVSLTAGLQTALNGIELNIGINLFINAFIALIIGGSKRMEGPIVGALVLGLLIPFLEFYMDSKWIMSVNFLLLLLFLMFRPNGILGEKRRIF